MMMAGLKYGQTAQTVSQKINRPFSAQQQVKMEMPGNSPSFVDGMEECCSSLVCKGLQGLWAKPDERAAQAQVKASPTAAR